MNLIRTPPSLYARYVTWAGALRAPVQFGIVEDPRHAYKLHAREPGNLGDTCGPTRLQVGGRRSRPSRRLSGKAVARSELRMMPTFPPPPPIIPYGEFSRSTAGRLAFQAAPFPVPFGSSQHRACPSRHEGLHLSFVHCVAAPYVRRCVRTVGSVVYRHSRSCLLYPRGPRSGLGYSVPVHQRLTDLIRPARGHIPISPTCGLYGMPSLCRCA